MILGPLKTLLSSILAEYDISTSRHTATAETPSHYQRTILTLQPTTQFPLRLFGIIA